MTATDTATQTRNLVALNADVVGYSRLIADDFDTTTRVMSHYEQLVGEKVAEAGGELISFVGDNFMALFEDAKDAIQASIAVAKAIEGENEDIPEHRQLRFRMGIDSGPVTVSGHQYHGDALNIASRIQSLAQPGGVSISGAVYRALDEPALRFRSTGIRELKNIPEGVEVFEFADLPSQHPPGTTGVGLSFEAPWIAVLPMHSNLSDEMGEVAAVIRADLLHRLAQIPGLHVLDAGVEERKPTKSPQYLLESGLHQLGPTVRAYAQLFEVATMNIIASHKLSAGTDGLLDLTEQLADDVARSIEVELVIGESAREYFELNDPVAIQQVYQGWYHLTTMTEEGILRASDLFGRVARSHPEKPFGAALKAFTLWMGASEGLLPNPQKRLDEASELARQAIALGDRTDLAQLVEASVLMSRGRTEDAIEKLEATEITRPTCDVTYALAGSVRRYMGQWEQSVDLLDRAMRLTAVNKPWYPTVKACSLYIGGRLEAAASLAESVLEHQPRNLEALLVLAAAQEQMGLHRRAQATANLVKERFPAIEVGSWLSQRPYQDTQLVETWKASLAKVGLIKT